MSTEAGLLRCPSCGAQADPESRSCRYCSAVLALVSCPSCFAPMFEGAKHCSRCGAEAARRAVERKARDCPECRERLDAVAVGAVTLEECRGCGGLFVDKPAFDRICTEREQQAVVLQARLAPPRGAASPARHDRYWPCPDWEFIRAGGLSRARAREIQDVREERERLQHEQRIAAIRSARLPADTGTSQGLDLGTLFSLFDDIFLQ